MDKVPHRYWDDMWLTDALPTPLDFSLGVRVKPVSRHIRDFVVEHLGPAPAVVEVGCGGSVWLPYFRQVQRCCGWPRICPALCPRRSGCPRTWDARRAGRVDVAVYNRA